MERLKYDVFMLLLMTSLSAVSPRQLPQKKHSVPHLEHSCVSLHSLPEDGVPVIMLHGLTDIKETWDGIYENIPFLAHRRVCVYDARNHGDSGWNDTFNVDVLADDLERFMHDMKIEKAALVGHSMGGLTAMKFTLKNPDKVDRLFVEDVSPIRISKEANVAVGFYLNLLVNSLSAIPDNADADTAEKAVMDYIREATNEPSAEPFFRKFPLRLREGVWQWKANFDVFIKAFNDPDSFLGKMEGRYDGKIYFIYGEASWFKVADDKEAIRKLFPNSEFHGIKGAGHVIHLRYIEFLTSLLNFLK